MTSLIHPSRPGFDKKMSALGDVVFEDFRFLVRQHQWIRNDDQFVLRHVILREFASAEDINGQIPFEEHPVISGDGFMNRIPATFLVVAASNGVNGLNTM